MVIWFCSRSKSDDILQLLYILFTDVERNKQRVKWVCIKSTLSITFTNQRWSHGAYKLLDNDHICQMCAIHFIATYFEGLTDIQRICRSKRRWYDCSDDMESKTSPKKTLYSWVVQFYIGYAMQFFHLYGNFNVINKQLKTQYIDFAFSLPLSFLFAPFSVSTTRLQTPNKIWSKNRFAVL